MDQDHYYILWLSWKNMITPVRKHYNPINHKHMVDDYNSSMICICYFCKWLTSACEIWLW